MPSGHWPDGTTGTLPLENGAGKRPCALLVPSGRWPNGTGQWPVLPGGFKHGQHLAFDSKTAPPLCNLYVSMLQCMGIEADKFRSDTGSLKGLEPTG